MRYQRNLKQCKQYRLTYPDSLLYIHLSGQDLAEQLTRGMSHIHAWGVQSLAHAFDDDRSSIEETPQES